MPLSLSQEGHLAAEPAAAFRGAGRVASWDVGRLWFRRLTPPDAWAPSCHLSSPGEECGPTGERMSVRSLCGSGADAAPSGVWRWKEAEGRDAGLQDDRAGERWCLPWVVWEESDSSRKPGRGQLTLIQRITPRGRHQPGQCRARQQGALSQERSGGRESSAFSWAALELPNLPPPCGQWGAGRGPTWGEMYARGWG